jgi:4-amino-4-deoxy-L-arabinose transferase-like glycosyltransferase
MKFFKRLLPLLRTQAPLFVGLFLIAPVFFFHAFRQPIPLGYAGMFTQMAEQIANANFVLPMDVPYYGPGGIPFVYPPLSLYLFAIAIKLGVSTWAYLRLVPAIFTLLALIPYYFLAYQLTRSKLASFIALVLTALAPSIYYTHVWSAGVVRGLALGLCFAGLLFYLHAIQKASWGNLALAGGLLGLLLMTHLLYVVFAALVGIALLLSNWKPRRVFISLAVLFLALLVAAPWLGLILSRHGLNSLLAASSSHRNTDFFALLLQDFSAGLGFLAGNLSHLADNWLLAGLAFAGLVLLLVKRDFSIPLIFILTLFVGEASIFLPISASLMAGIFSAQVFQWAREKMDRLQGWKKASVISAAMINLALIVLIGASNLAEISKYEPEIDAYSLKMAKFVQQETAPNLTYFYIGKINEAEWFPYLLERTPVIGIWGSEWKGTYAEELETMIAMRACQNNKDWVCMQNLLEQRHLNPGLLIGPANRWLEIAIKETRAWDVIYRDERYLVWQRR